MKKMNRSSGTFFYLFVITSVVFILVLFFAVLYTRQENITMSAYYQAEKIMSEVFFQLRTTSIDKIVETNTLITAFGIYDQDGKSHNVYGNAPQELPQKTVYIKDKPEYDESEGVVRIIRSLRPPGIEHRSPYPDRRIRNNKMLFNSYVYIEIRILALKRNRLLYLISILLVPLIVIFLAGLLIYSYRKSRHLEVMLEKKDEMARLGEASRTLAHEIKNPLGAIRLQVGILRRLLPDDFMNEVDIIDEEAVRIQILSERIGDFLRDPIGNPQKIDVVEFIYTLKEKVDYPIDLIFNKSPLYILFDPQRFRSVIDNLIRNAIESMEKCAVKSNIICFISTNEGILSIRICDRGEEKIIDSQRIFDPFFTTKTNGSGIGLTIVKRFVEAVGGKVFLKSSDDGVDAVIELSEVLV